MFGLDESATTGIGIAIGVAVLLAVVFVLSMLCALLSLVTGVFGAPEAGLLLAQPLLLIG
jgi:hypothetical protein